MGPDYSLALGVQPVNVLQSMQAGQMGQQAHAFNRQNALNALIKANASGIMSGDQAALNALAGFGQEGLDTANLIQQQGIQNARADRQTELAERQEQRLSQEQKLEMAEILRQQGVEAAAMQREKLEGIYKGLSYFHANGDRDGFAAFATQNGVKPADVNFDSFPAEAAMLGDVLEVYNGFLEQAQPGQSANWQRFEGPDGGVYAFNPETRAIEPLMAAGNAKPSAAEDQISRLMETGIDRETAIGIADGRITTTRDPITGEAQLIDKATGRIITGPPKPSVSIPAGPQPTPVQQPSMPGDTDFSTATGASGFAQQSLNTLFDAVGAELPYQNNETATQAMENLKTQTMVALAAGVPGRPSNFLLEQFQAMAAEPNSFFQGPGRTREKLNQTRAFIGQAMALNQGLLSSNVSPTTKSEAEANIATLQQLLNDYDRVIQSYGSRGTNANTTGSGVQWRIVE